MTDYSKLSDFNINRMVLRIVIGKNPVRHAHNADGRSAGIKGDNGRFKWFDYCNSWADAGPIIVENCISMVWDCAEDASSAWWNAVDKFDDCRIQYQANPLRAAMIVFLMMNEG